MKNIIVVFFLLCAAQGYAQNSSSATNQAGFVKFHSSVQVGLLEGEEKAAFQAQAINGIQYKTWYGGVGIGIDNYKFRTIPLFFDLQKNVFKRNTTPFVFGDIGLHFPWLRNDQKTFYSNSEFTNGVYCNVGVGYKINLLKSSRLTFSTAFSLKKLENNYTYTICPFVGPCFEQSEQMKYTLRRLALNIGLFF
jgi:hypothetical protein